ncbi:protein of unknown function [Candidatus Methylomirabilis oxygeniifera]|uniref:Uncharacterized protein n=1 Tax=Methylomirabilis oxygeniifera TaxID=671143 RepID=D5MLD8_METO1|nr:protein of unknown function [Candidatus Methylomirabilis oxyfera]
MRFLRIAYPGAYSHAMNRGLADQDAFTNRFDGRLAERSMSPCGGRSFVGEGVGTVRRECERGADRRYDFRSLVNSASVRLACRSMRWNRAVGMSRPC